MQPLTIGNKIFDFNTPLIMGILNVTPDSFYDGRRLDDEDALIAQAGHMLTHGADILDIGGMSTRPGAQPVSIDEELHRVMPAIESILKKYPEALISIDTVHAEVATKAVEAGALMINDVSAGEMDAEMLVAVSMLQVPYIIMHMQGRPATMQQNPTYLNVADEVYTYLAQKVAICRQAGIKDIIIDPGFGFGKTVEHNYALLKALSAFKTLNLPILAGVSRKSMICKVINQNPQHALNGTTAVNMLALLNGANILRVHDVKEARETVMLFEAYRSA